MLNEVGLIMVYHSLPYSHLALNKSIWGRYSSARITFILQKRILRLIFHLDYWESCKSTFINKKNPNDAEYLYI